MEKAKTYSFSANGLNKVWLEGFKDRLAEGNFSQAVVDGLKLLDSPKGKSKVEKQFDEYCRLNSLSKDAQLQMLMGPLRVSLNGLPDSTDDTPRPMW